MAEHDPSINTAGGKLVNSVALTLVARAAIIFATGVGLPMAGWMMQRAVTSVDQIGQKIDTMRDQAIETNGTVKMIQQNQQIQGSVIADHETRMRILENFNRNIRSN